MTLLGQSEIPYLKLQHQLFSPLIAGNRDWRRVAARRRNFARLRDVEIHPQRLALLLFPNIVQRIGYVERHFGDLKTVAIKPEHATLAAYFNLDNGAGRIRGVNLQGNEAVRPIFDAWLQPFHYLGAATLTTLNTGDRKSTRLNSSHT